MTMRYSFKRVATWAAGGIALMLLIYIGYIHPFIVRTDCDSAAKHSVAAVYGTSFDMKYPQMRDAYAGYYDECVHRQGL